MTVDERLPRLRDALKSAGRRHTSQRERLLRTLIACGKAVSVQELLRREGGNIDPVTAYRLLTDLLALGLVIRFLGLNNTFVFALRHDREGHVHHLVCDRCGQSLPFYGCAVEEFLQATPSPQGFLVEHHIFTLYGTCPACQNHPKARRKEKYEETE